MSLKLKDSQPDENSCKANKIGLFSHDMWAKRLNWLHPTAKTFYKILAFIYFHFIVFTSYSR